MYTVGAAHSLNSTFDNMPIFTNRSSALFISSVAENGTFHFFLKMGHVFSFCSNFALILIHLSRPAENASGKLHFSWILIFSASSVMHFIFWQNVLIGWYQKFIFWNHSDPNKLSVFFSTKTFNLLVIPFCEARIIISPSNFILCPVTVRAVLLVIFIIGLFNFLQVCKFIIDRSEPESNWNLTDLFSTLTVKYLRTTFSDLFSLFVRLTLFLVIFLFLLCEPLCPNLSQFWHFLYDMYSPWPNVLFHRDYKPCIFFFVCH